MQASAGCAASSCKSLWLTGSSLPCEAVPLWTTLDLRRAAEGWSEHIADHPNFTQHRGREAAAVARSKVPRHTPIGCYQEDCEPRVWNTAPRRESGRSSAPTGDRRVTIPTFSCGPVIGSPPHHPPLSCGPVIGSPPHHPPLWTRDRLTTAPPATLLWTRDRLTTASPATLLWTRDRLTTASPATVDDY